MPAWGWPVPWMPAWAAPSEAARLISRDANTTTITSFRDLDIELLPRAVQRSNGVRKCYSSLLNSMTQSAVQVAPPSQENACSHRHDVAVTSDQT